MIKTLTFLIYLREAAATAAAATIETVLFYFHFKPDRKTFTPCRRGHTYTSTIHAHARTSTVLKRAHTGESTHTNANAR